MKHPEEPVPVPVSESREAAPQRTPWETVRAMLEDPGNRREVVLGLALLALFLVWYAGTFVALAGRWNQDANYSHGYLVPVVSLYLAFQWKAKPRWTPDPRGGMFVGYTLILFGIAVSFATLVVASLVAECLSLFAVLTGLVLVIGGWNWFSRLWPSLLFLVFMVPWPSGLYSRIAFPLQLFVSKVSAVTLEILGIPVLNEGNLIHLPGQTMHVAEACSGLRQLTAFLAICTCAALLVARPMWYRVTLLLSSIPIAIAINVLRVTGTGLLLQYGDPKWTEGWMHTAEGLIMVGLGLGALLLETALIDWLLVDESRAEGSPSPLGAAAGGLRPAKLA